MRHHSGMRRLLDPRLWSFETRVATVLLLPALLVVALVIESQVGRWWALCVLLAIRWLVISPWTRRRESRSDTAPTDAFSG